MVYIYITENYSPIKNDKIMPFLAICMDLEMTILSEGSQEEKCHVMSYVESKI